MRRNTVKASTRLFEISSRVIGKLFEKSQLSKSRQKGPSKDLIPPSIKHFKFNKLWMCSLPLLPLAATLEKKVMKDSENCGHEWHHILQGSQMFFMIDVAFLVMKSNFFLCVIFIIRSSQS